MLALEVPELMGQDGNNLAGAEPLQQGVEEHDALGATKASEIGVAMRRAFRPVHHEQPVAGEVRTLQQRLNCATGIASASGENLLKIGAMKVG